MCHHDSPIGEARRETGGLRAMARGGATALRLRARAVDMRRHAWRIGPALISTLTLADPAATERLGRALAPHLRPGDVVGLTGGLGAGKSVLARALIGARLAAAGRTEEIPSPSYTLVQSYEAGGTEIWHADLYRLGTAGEIAELGLEDAFDAAICVVEWFDRLGSAVPPRALLVAFGFAPEADDARVARITALGPGWDWLPDALAGMEA
jgi:tRNA threonylcarbamoyladenosine biosynthesis protein TsaE